MLHRALITGISGFVGGHLAEELLHCGDAVLGCSPDGRWAPTSHASLAGRVELFAWDLGLPDGLTSDARRTIERFDPDGIYHLAALSVPEDCGAEQPTPQAMAINVAGTRRVLELAASLGRRPRVLLASSSRVYASPADGAPPLAETAPLGPRSGYGWTKLLAEEEVRRASDRLGCEALIARAFQHTGPGQNDRMMLPHWARQFAAGGSAPVEVYTRQAQIDLTDVRDVVRAYRLLMERGRPGEVYNVGSGISRASGEILELLRAMADPCRPIVETHPGPKQDPIAEIGRLVDLTGWRPQVPLATTVADTLAWWRQFLARG